MKKISTAYLCQAGIIAALYAVVTIALAPISFGPIQFRVAEALTILPVFTPAAIPGLTVGCIISNAVGVALGSNIAGPLDIVFGSIATLLAAVSTRWLSKIKIKNIPWLAPLPPIIFNGLIVGGELAIFVPELTGAYLLCMAEVALGEAVVCYILGIPLIAALNKAHAEEKIFRL